MRKIAIIGGGAAGLCCACETAYLAKQSGKAVRLTIFETNERVGKKLLATGNGRCNLSNLGASPADYNNNARTFVAPAFAFCPPQATLDFFARLGLYTHADAEGRVYPLSNQAAGVLDALRLEAARLGVKMQTSRTVQTIRRRATDFLVDNTAFDFVVLCCGGKAAVKQYNAFSLLESLGIAVEADAPALVKLTTSSPVPKQLKGLRAAASLRLILNGNEAAETRGELQFSDGTLSGICAMDLSPLVNRFFAAGGGEAVVLADFVPSMEETALVNVLHRLCIERDTLENLLSGLMPKQLSLAVLRKANLAPNRESAALSEDELAALAAICKRFPFAITGTKGYADAQVMLGGASLAAFDPETLEAKAVPGLFCCGELLDVDGRCGGYNLQWAFASARLCAKTMVEKS